MRPSRVTSVALVAAAALSNAAISVSPAAAAPASPKSSCSTTSALFERAFVAATAGLSPRLRGQIPYRCVVTTRNAALAADGDGQMNARLGAERVVAVALTLQKGVTYLASQGPPSSPAPKGDFVTYNFNPSTGSLLDFGLRTLSANYRYPNLSHLGTVTSGTVVLH